MFSSGVNQQSGMRCRRIARQETKDYHGMAAVVCPGSLHWDASHRRHVLTRGSAYDQKQSMILFHSIQQSLVKDVEFGQGDYSGESDQKVNSQ